MYKSIGRRIELISFRDGNGMTQWCKSLCSLNTSGIELTRP